MHAEHLLPRFDEIVGMIGLYELLIGVHRRDEIEVVKVDDRPLRVIDRLSGEPRRRPQQSESEDERKQHGERISPAPGVRAFNQLQKRHPRIQTLDAMKALAPKRASLQFGAAGLISPQ